MKEIDPCVVVVLVVECEVEMVDAVEVVLLDVEVLEAFPVLDTVLEVEVVVDPADT